MEAGPLLSSFRVPPAKASVLSCEHPPSAGGETEFADMRAAYDALDDDLRHLLDNRLVTHSYLYSQGSSGGIDSLNFTEEQRATMGPTDRPAINVHDVTGRRSLCIGRHAYRLSGMDDDDAKVLLDDLFAAACQPPRLFLHRAHPWNYAEPRIMWHTRVAGDAEGAALRYG